MNTEFNWWLLIVGLVIGAGLVWLVLADTRRREIDLAERERESEARWIGGAMRDAGRKITDSEALDVLRLHEAYLAAPPPDELEDEEETLVGRSAVVGARSIAGAGPGETRAPMAHPMGAAEPPEPARGAER